jgi:hypothetical protein
MVRPDCAAPAENAFQLEKKNATLRENQVRRCEFGWPRELHWHGAGGSSEYPVCCERVETRALSCVRTYKVIALGVYRSETTSCVAKIM